MLVVGVLNSIVTTRYIFSYCGALRVGHSYVVADVLYAISDAFMSVLRVAIIYLKIPKPLEAYTYVYKCTTCMHIAT